ncbi:MAG: thioesterase family protein [Hyphomonadaceae bacterium]|nr:thioesterase family protein [Hyphomonadaceae bacterium]
MCLAAVRQQYGDLPPLRSAHIAFAGPVSGDVAISTRVLRQGKSAHFICADLSSDAGFGTHATFCFGADRASSQSQTRFPMPDVPHHSAVTPFFPSDWAAPHFTQHFSMLLASGSAPVSGAAEADMCLWLKPKTASQGPLDVALLALGDVPPPAALSLYRQLTPLSTMTWAIDLMTTDLNSPDGWYLARLKSDAIENGYSAQSMGLWASNGTPILASKQCVALFG